MIYPAYKWGGGYSKSEVDTLLNGKSDTSHTHTTSDITDFPTLSTVATSGSYNDLSNKPTIPIVDSALSSTSTNALQNKVINTELSKKANTGHTHTVSDVTDFPTLATVATSGSYNDLSNKPATMTPTSHTHGNITNDGKIGSNANKPLITTTGGTVTTGSFGTSANTFCEGNDSRLSDARTPTAHTHTVSDVTDFPNLSTVATSGSYNDLSNKPTIPTVNNATLTIQKNGTNVKTFTANASSNVTANITVPTKTSDLTNDSNFITEDATKIPLSGTYNITGTDFFKDVNTSSIIISGGHAWNTGAYLGLSGGARSEKTGTFTLQACKTDGIIYRLIGYPNGTLTWGTKNVAMQEDVIPRSGGDVLAGSAFHRTVDNGSLRFGGGSEWGRGALVVLHGKDSTGDTPSRAGAIYLRADKGSESKTMLLYPDGTWTWTGQAVQITSDQRYKQQIAEIDDKLLDAWEDVDLVQFKYNDAVDQKGDNARLHTGYVVQQINEACKSHDVDISEYGLYCHEEYPEETEEVEVEQEDGTKTKEKKVIREASEHYSLRYTEALIVECAYLRRENSRLKERLSKIEKLLNI